jgi:ABC-2 type transport system permease protein
MLNDLRHDGRIFIAAAGMALRGQLQYRRAFVIGSISQLAIAVTDFLGIMVLIRRFHAIDGWSLSELGLLYGLVATALSAALLLAGGVGDLDGLVRSGEFDGVRIRPCGSLMLVAGQRCELRRLGRLVQGLAVLLWALARLHQLTPAALAITLLAVVGGTALFIGFLITQAAASFWTIDGLEVFNVATYGGETLGSYPLTVFQRWMRVLLLGVVPVATVCYCPALVLTHRSPGGAAGVLLGCAPLAGGVVLGLSRLSWRAGLARYSSTGS